MSDSKAWIRDIVASLEGETEAETCRRVLEPCGRRCFPASLGKEVRTMWEVSTTARAFLDRLQKASPHVTIVGEEEIHVVYPKCHCSVGWAKELFRQATGRDVDVVALTTIIRGGTGCRFRVDLGIALDAPLR
jgi:predicted hydrocarbon binding protein